MKTILFYFLLTILAVSCQLKQSENTEKEVSDNVSNSDTEECIADTISATAIFWIDKAETKHCKEWGFRTVSGYVQPGEQFVQLRCLYGKVKAK